MGQKGKWGNKKGNKTPHTHSVCVDQEKEKGESLSQTLTMKKLQDLRMKLMMIYCMIWGLESSKPTNPKVCCKNLIWLVSFEGET